MEIQTVDINRMQHLTYHRDVQEDASNEWQEAVTADVYHLLK